MNPLDWLSDQIYGSRKLEYVVKTYGPDFLSTYGGGSLLAVSALGVGTVAPFIAIPAAAGLISLVNQVDHDYRERERLDFYRDQIAQLRGKQPEDATREDMHIVAGLDGHLGDCPNNILKNDIQKNDQRRNYAMLFHGISACLFGVVAGVVFPLVEAALALPLAQAAAGIGGLLLFQQIDKTVTDIGRVLLDMNEPTAHDAIKEIQASLHKGQRVSEMQIFTVMLGADKSLAERVQKDFGAKFEDLYLSDKHKALAKHGASQHLSQVTAALNRGTMEAEDLVLTLCNQLPVHGAQELVFAEMHADHPAHHVRSETHHRDALAKQRHEAVVMAENSSRELH